MKYPSYFVIDFDIFVKIYKDGDEVIGVNSKGSPYPVRKALVEGNKISKEEFENEDASRLVYTPQKADEEVILETSS